MPLFASNKLKKLTSNQTGRKYRFCEAVKFDRLKKQIVSIKDYFGAEIENKKELYDLYPVEKRLENHPNGGVLGVCKTRKKDINFL